MHCCIAFSGFDQGPNGRGRGVENSALVAFNHLPKATRVGVSRYAFKNDLGCACCQGAVGDIGVTGNPTNICSTPEHVIGL